MIYMKQIINNKEERSVSVRPISYGMEAKIYNQESRSGDNKSSDKVLPPNGGATSCIRW